MRIQSLKILTLTIIIHTSISGILIPDPRLPLEITPSYTKDIGIKGTKLIFRFFFPQNSDKYGAPTQLGIGATYLQYIGIKFNAYSSYTDFNFEGTIKHSCSLIRLDNNININLEPSKSETYNGYDPTYYTETSNAENNIAYCKIISRNPNEVFLPGYNYKLTLTLTNDITSSYPMKNILSFTVFSSSKNSPSKEIFDIGNFPNILILPKENHISTNSVNLNLISSSPNTLDLDINHEFDFTITLSFNDWFNWDNYIVCVRYPKDRIGYIENSISMEISQISTVVPQGNIILRELEEDDERKVIGFSLDSSFDNVKGQSYNLNFKGFTTKNKACINSNNNCYFEILVRYKNSYVIYGYIKIVTLINSKDITLNVIHPQTKINSDTNQIEDTFDVFQSGAFPIKFIINIGEKDVTNKYISIKQIDAQIGKHVTFIAPTCDFSSFGITDMDSIPKCYPISYINSDSTIPSGIFFYYPGTLTANTQYYFTVWIFFDECGTKNNEYLLNSDSTREFQFDLSMYNEIITNKYGEDRLIEDNLFLNGVITPNGIVCYNTYMGSKNYNGYVFNYEDYTSSNFNTNGVNANLKEKLLYREYFDWNIYTLDASTYSTNSLLNNLYLDSSTFKEKYIYSSGNKITNTDSILLRNKLILPSGSYEKLGQFFPMGMGVDSNKRLTALKAKFFAKYSSNFFTKNTIDKCFISWNFGYSTDSNNPKSFQPTPVTKSPQRYNWITNDLSFSDDKTGIYSKVIDKITDNTIYSIDNVGWEYDSTNNNLKVGEWSFGDDKTLKSQISTDSPIYIYFGYADTCHKYYNLDQTITSLYTPIEIIMGIKYEDSTNNNNNRYLRVLRFIKLFPEGGVFNDISQISSFVYYGVEDVVVNHFSFMNPDQKAGVCLIEVNQKAISRGSSSIIDSSDTFLLWIFLGSLIESEYSLIASNYPIGNLNSNVKSYGYSSQHSMGKNNFYTDIETNLKTDISSPLYTMAMSMTSIYQSGSTSYLFYLGSLILIKNPTSHQIFQDITNGPLLIPYYCPFYISNGNSIPYALGVFPSFIGAFGKFNSMVDFGHDGFKGFLTKKISDNQYNRLILSTPKMVIDPSGNNEGVYFNTLSFVIEGDGTNYLKIWNGRRDSINDNQYDTIDSFLLFFNEHAYQLDSNTISANDFFVSKYISSTPFYAFGKKWNKLVTGYYKNNKLGVTNSAPENLEYNEPYLKIITGFVLDYDSFICQEGNKFCADDLIAFWGLSSNHDAINYFSNYVPNSNKYVISHWAYDTYYGTSVPKLFGDRPALYFKDPAISLHIEFSTPISLILPIYSIVSFEIISANDNTIITNSYCNIRNVLDVNYISSICDTDESTGRIACPIVDPSEKFDFYCYMIDGFGIKNFIARNFKIRLPNQDTDLDYYVNDNIFYSIENSNNHIMSFGSEFDISTTISATYILEPYNLNSYNKLELKIPLQREAHPGMQVVLTLNLQDDYLVLSPEETLCKFSFYEIKPFGNENYNYDDVWKEGNGLLHNCKIKTNNLPQTTNPGTDLIYAWIDKRAYKASYGLSTDLYIYISPIKSKPFPTVNDGKIIGYVHDKVIFKTDLKIPFSNTQTISTDPTSQILTQITSVTKMTSDIIGDISDYTFQFKLDDAVTLSVLNTYSVNAIRLFLPEVITFTNINEVMCYDVDLRDTILACSFEDNNIITIILSVPITSSSTSKIKNILITSFVNPLITTAINYACDYISIDSYGIYSNLISGLGLIPAGKINQPSYVCGLRFYHVVTPVSSFYPRESATFTFKVGFDYANGYCQSASAKLTGNVKTIIVEFPVDYNLFINKIPSVTVDEYGTNEATVPYLVQNILVNEVKIYGRRLHISIGTNTPAASPNFKYWLIVVGPLINPNSVPESGYTDPFKISVLDIENHHYHTTGLNDNTYTSDIIGDDNPDERENEYQWYRGNQVKLRYKYIIDIEYNQIYNRAFFQPGRFYLCYIHTSHPDPKAYLYPSYNDLTFPSPLKSMESKYVAPTLYGEGMPYYMGVPCTTPEGMYIVSPTQSNNEDYIPPPTLIITVKLLSPAEITFESPKAVPTFAGLRLYYYFSEPNVDSLRIQWERDTSVSDLTEIDTIKVNPGTITNITTGYTNVYTTIRVGTTALLGPQKFTAVFINKCYSISPSTFQVTEASGLSTLSISESIDISTQLTIQNAEDDPTLESDDIKINVKTNYYPSFLYCELECFSLTYDEASSLMYPHFTYMSKKIWAYNNIFRRYATFYFDSFTNEKTLYFQNLLRGYSYKLACAFQSTEYHDIDDASDIVPYGYGTIGTGINTIYPENTQCNTFYFSNKPTEQVKQALVNYCQYLYGVNGGYNSGGCIVCTDASGMYRAPGYNIDNYFYCLAEECSDHWKDENVAKELYEVYNNSTAKKKAFTVCATSNRVCVSSSHNLNTIFQRFISEVKTNDLANQYLERSDVKYNSAYNQLNYKDEKLDSSNLKIDILKPVTQTGYGKWKAYFLNSKGLTVNCYWKLLLEERGTPQIEEVASCMSYDYNCGTFPADNNGIEYEVPDNGKREPLKIQRKYNLFITCANQVPSPIYFSDLIMFGPYSVVVTNGIFLKVNFYTIFILALILF